jgi:Phosphatidylserine synthase
MKVFRLLKLPDLVSLLNLLFGMAAILFAFNGFYSASAVCCLIAAVADGADGYIARKTSGGPLGPHLDSLIDTVSFGVAPAILIYCMIGNYLSLSVSSLSAVISSLSIVVACFYVICGVLRLARYNAFPSEKPEYSGVPITAACVFIAVFVIFLDGSIKSSIELPLPYLFGFFFGVMLLLSLLMISTLTYPKVMKKLSFGLLALFFSAAILSIFIDSVYVSIFPGILCLLMLLYLFSPVIRLLLKKESIKL